MPKPKITIGAELSMNHDRYCMTLMRLRVSNVDSYRLIQPKFALLFLMGQLHNEIN